MDEINLLEDQLKMLEDLPNDLNTSALNLENPTNSIINSTPVETAETLRGEVPFNFTPENPTNKGVITNVVTPTQTAPQRSVVQNTVSAPIQAAPITNLDSAPIFINLSTNTYQTKTDFLTLKDGEKSRITLANLNFQRSHIHYLNGLGKFKCLSTYDDANISVISEAVCCHMIDEKTGAKVKPKNRLLVPIIEYPVSRTDGKSIVPGAAPKLKMWDMNYVEEKALMSILENYKIGDTWDSIDLASFDIAINKGKTGEYSTISLTPVPSWRNNFSAAINAELAKINLDFYSDAFKECAKIVSPETIQKRIEAIQQEQLMANQIANSTVPDVSQLGIGNSNNFSIPQM